MLWLRVNMFSNELIFMNVWCKGGKYLLIRQVMFEDKKYCDNLLRSKENAYVQCTLDIVCLWKNIAM